MNDFTGIWIPAEILAIQDMNLTEKILAAQVLMLSRSGECTAKNRYLSVMLGGLSETSISQTLQSLKKKEYVCIEDGKSIGNKRTMYPSLKLLQTLCKNLTEGPWKWEQLNPPSVKILKSLYKILTEATQESYTPYVRILQSLYKNLTEPIYKDQNKEESKEESKEENNKGVDEENFSVADAPVPEVVLPVNNKKKGRKAPTPTPPSVVTKIKELIEKTSPGYYWDGRNAKAAAEINAKLRLAILTKSKDKYSVEDVTDEEVIHSLTMLINMANQLTSFYHFTDLPTLNTRFNEILTQIKDGKTNTTSTQGRGVRARPGTGSVSAEFDGLAERLLGI